MGANIDAAAKQPRIGISADRAATYHADEIGTQAVSASMATACCQLRSDAGITGSWKLEIEEDMASRA